MNLKFTQYILAGALGSLLLLSNSTFAQYGRTDSLRGGLGPERSWWDLKHYDLSVEIIPSKKYIKGSNKISYQVKNEAKLLQLDLQEPLAVTSITQEGEELSFRREGAVYWVTLTKKQVPGALEALVVQYEGVPKEAVRPPWDGGITWQKDSKGLDFIASSNQGIGSSIWWPLKDHPADEVDSLDMHVTVPKGLLDISNGRLVEIEVGKDTDTFHWKVVNPINDYGVNINIGDYAQFGEKYAGEKGTLDMDYFVLRENLEKAKVHFQDARRMMQAFEHWFGPYPFYEDGFKLVEAPYLGMEHQSSVTYGNGYQNGYRGRDLSGTGWGMKFDFIIIHEAGHEWFANNITYKDVADMWIHESFTNYSESLFLDYHYGKEAGQAYVRGTRMNILNDKPIIGDYGVNQRGSGDMYYKGGNLLNMLRQIVQDDGKWRIILRGLNKEFYHQTVTTQQVESYISTQAGLNLGKVFDQYLRDVRIPIFEYYFQGEELQYRWTNAVKDFDMPVDVLLDGKAVRLQTKTAWQTLEVGTVQEVVVDPDYYVGVLKSRD
ncbi:MAG: M1 family metallopeptidase [Algoriphagus sp.]|jgi:aminopeptidase N|uniref:M1 family metallopeptidase n=1 Tax=Algoriphagus sp. TaxID=1872435 RepID=UPI00275785C0|nr:M1 family metallopeptidase [Algoriphagus sp.]MDP4956561.1 M1 family metallopeptidase [Algoriphagus sp.]MDP5124952.1 M1 family metallopeptidase [Algoriphagus sp.]